MNAPGESSVRLENVFHRYGDVLALDDVSLDFPAGRMIGLIGPDGVGKSTLLALIAGVRKIQTGTVEALGGDMADKRHRRRSVYNIAYMPQGLGKNLYATLSIHENLSFFGRLFDQNKAEREQRIDRLLAATGLTPFKNRPAGKLSGGMKQKLGLCCALIHDPDLLILDEPTTGVDPLSRRQFWDLISDIRRERPQMTVLVATAYMEEAAVFDLIAAMDEGKVIAQGTPQSLLEKTGAAALEEAFIQLLPADKQASHQPVVVPPRPGDGGDIAIEAIGLTKRFGDFTAVDHVEFAIERGEIFGFLGSNGCGKTTTMKMMTGLSPATEGEARLFGKVLDARDMQTRRRVGYMSQSFSLYGELTVFQNIELHAHLFDLSKEEMGPRIREVLERFELETVKDSKPDSLPLGVKQRLQLAVAVLHRPEMLILDEPTSGVDPIARDNFWRLLITLSREEGVTIFISTHFMNEAERCDRISLMHAGKVLAVGSPDALKESKKADSLDDAFVDYLKEASGIDAKAVSPSERTGPLVSSGESGEKAAKDGAGGFHLRSMLAYARRETKELLRDPIRLAFALIGPIILLITFGYGISFDVEELPYVAIDQDRSTQSREFLENFSGSRYFEERPSVSTPAAAHDLLRSGDVSIVIEIPAGFGQDLFAARQPEIGVSIDGAMPFRAETARGYVEGVTQAYISDLARRNLGIEIVFTEVDIKIRYLYNQAFKSTNAITPGIIMLLCSLIPSMLTAVGIVREKELGSITNFYATPVTRTEFLLGKQIPYVVISYISFLSLATVVMSVFAVPIKGSLLALNLGALAYVWATTGLGILVSTFVKTQIAAVFAAAIVTMLLTMNFSGFLTPVSSLSGGAIFMSKLFPAAYFQQISVGSFTKALDFYDLLPELIVLVVFAFVFFFLSVLLLKKQER
ncbi:ribosome-associated ATPase/putative transporter RbbA [Sneathiella chungangensis]|uniref:Ribosome-associated ATPase/putative transporter RbbA n=1 Tax=Sneathiella chungangensis TaxID=1418234 RepID=A0A845MI05_9PROT|nr:ribosome-associated ATPase/putative transporter RbbA [Sneathiella chungangensis]MZR22907.1 ribosome-associated ATPase/putative transporter RbbA [Sneathiella chungangensis]